MIELIHIFLIHKHFTEIILMLLFILMIIILIIIIGLVVRYIYVQAHILSSREFRKTAEKKSAKIRIKNPEITCDYCGCVINTAKEKKCPNCGAVYGDDKELKDRYKVDEVAIEKMANVAAQEAVSKAHKRGLETLKHLRIAIIAFVVALILIGVYFITADRKVHLKLKDDDELCLMGLGIAKLMPAQMRNRHLSSLFRQRIRPGNLLHPHLTTVLSPAFQS